MPMPRGQIKEADSKCYVNGLRWLGGLHNLGAGAGHVNLQAYCTI